MRFALDVYRRLIAIQIRSQLEYRVAFLLDVAAAGLGTAINFGTIALIFQRFEQIGGWSLSEVALLYGMVETAFGAMDFLFGGFDPDTFAPMVQRGSFDQLLLRPINITVQVLGSQFLLRRIGRIAQGVAALGIALSWADIHWTVLKILFLPVVLVSLIGFFGGLFIVGATTTFWTVQRVEAINIFTYGGSEMMSYPMHIYSDWMRRFFTYVIPAIFLTYYPALYILDRPDPLGMPSFAPLLSPVVGIGTLALALRFWDFGVRHYSSTGT